MIDQQHKWMEYAITLAKKALELDEIPIGAILVHDNKIIGSGYNQSIHEHDPCAHAEIIALQDAGRRVHNHRLVDSIMYVTLEPCLMCFGALIHARVAQVVFGAYDDKVGCLSGHALKPVISHLNHQITWQGGIYRDRCQTLLQQFFLEKR